MKEDLNEKQQHDKQEEYREKVKLRVKAVDDNATQQPQQEHDRTIPKDELFKGAKNGEKGDATLLYWLLHLRFCFDTTAQEWYRFNGVHWELDEEGDVYRACEQLQEQYRKEQQGCLDQAGKAKDQGDKDGASILEARARHFEKACDRLNRANHLRNVLQLAAKGRRNSLAVNGRVWDKCPFKLPVANGLVDLKTGELEPGRPELYIRRASPVAYDPEATCPNWDEYLVSCVGKERAAFLQRFFGMAIMGIVKEHKVLVLTGVGGNGKSILVDILGDILGLELSTPAQAELLLEQSHTRSSQGHTADIAHLCGKRLVWCSETNPGRKIDLAGLKTLSGGEKLIARKPHAPDFITFTPAFYLVLVTNHKPTVDPDDTGLWRRLLVCNFPLEFVDREPEKPNERRMDTGLKARLLEELPGILRWLVEGALAYQRQGLDVPLSVQEETQGYRDEDDFLGEWLDQRCEKDGRVYAGMTGDEYKLLDSFYFEKSYTLYTDFLSWASDAGIKNPLSQKKWEEKLKRRFPWWKSSINYYGGLRLLDS